MRKFVQAVAIGFLVLELTYQDAHAQNMSDPYSAAGIGTIDWRAYNRTSGMASTGIALPSTYYYLDNNPAALTGLTRSFYLIDAAATGKTVYYTGDPINSTNSNAKDFWIKRLSVAVKINNFWGSSFGIRQFSNINYKLTGTKSEQGSANNYTADYQGDGGLNEYYWTNAIALGKHFSIGVKSSVIAGARNETETIADESLQSVISTKQQDYMGQLHFEFGAQYAARLSKNWDISLGGKYAPKTRILSDRTLTVQQNSTTIVNSEFIKRDFFYLPNSYAAGLALKHSNKTTFAVDYSFEDWSSLNIVDQGWSLVSSHRVSAGAEFSQQKRLGNLVAEKGYYQFGLFYGNSYLQSGSNTINEYGVTFGKGGSIKGNLMYNLSLEAGTRGTTRAGLIREKYLQLTIGFSFRDFLFSKGKKYD
jgi:hypothetical protein